jgi:hypothetical protein
MQARMPGHGKPQNSRNVMVAACITSITGVIGVTGASDVTGITGASGVTGVTPSGRHL